MILLSILKDNDHHKSNEFKLPLKDTEQKDIVKVNFTFLVL